MDTDVYYKLQQMKQKYGESRLGQICQNLLALSLSEILKPQNIEVRNVEGMDIVIENPKYAIEVKTTSKSAVNFAEKDFKGLKDYKNRRYESLLAVLKLDMHKEWMFISTERLRHSGSYSIGRLFTDDKYKDFASQVQKCFEDIVKRYSERILSEGERFLKELLKEKGLKYSGE